MGIEWVEEEFVRKAERAEALAPASEAAREPLVFAAVLLRAQGEFAREAAARGLSGDLAADAPGLLQAWQRLQTAIAEHGPDGLAAQAAGPVEVALLEAHWRGEKSAAPYLARALLRPWAAALRQGGGKAQRQAGACAFCGSAPSLGYRKNLPESDGAARFLCCALCGLDTQVLRIQCPSCGENDPARLPSWSAPAWPNARIEACESCRRYVKSIDLTLDARPLPEVDELLSLGLDLWAQEQGLVRLEPGLAGV